MTRDAPAYHRPARLDEALTALAGGHVTVLAGGTDYYAARVGRLVCDDLLDVTAIEELRGIRQDEAGVTIGGTTTWNDVASAPLPPALRCLQSAARLVGGLQVQTTGTLAGNLCNASPAADGIPPLLALGAEVVLRSVGGERVLPLGEFVLGNRKTARRPDELLTAIRLPPWSRRARSAFRKLGSRTYLVISIVMVAAVVDTDGDGVVRRAGIAVGACSAVAQRLPALERKLIGRRREPQLADRLTESDLDVLSPIDDVRATAAYRRDAAQTLVRRALAEVLS